MAEQDLAQWPGPKQGRRSQNCIGAAQKIEKKLTKNTFELQIDF
ncbi:MAG: hypothetical protein Q4F57_00940 [Weeksellaceae bacterium]|nr:hypothetical protein [Weeksellaceae bacterium]